MKNEENKKYKKTPQRIKIILDCIGSGLKQYDAAAMAGINQDTLTNWKKSDSDFSEQIDKKEIEYKQSLIKTVRNQSTKSWQAAAWLLERKWKDEFANRMELGGKDGQELGVIILPNKNNENSVGTAAETSGGVSKG